MSVDAPEAEGPQVQAPPSRDERMQVAIKDAQAELGVDADGQSLTETKPEASTPDGTGDDEAPDSEKETDTESDGSEPAKADIDWSDPEAREKHLKSHDAELNEAHERDAEERLANQRRSLQGQLDLAGQARAREQRETLLTELDLLRTDDPEAYAERLNSDVEAAGAVRDRNATISPAVMEQAAIKVATDQSVMLFREIPELEAVAAEGSDAWRKVVDPETGGIFGHIKRTAFTEGKQTGADEYKNSKEHREAIEAAEKRGAHDALGESGMASPPPAEDGVPASSGGERKFDNSAQQAAADAARELGREVAIDFSKIRLPKGRRR